jgi:hypothetical protein
VNTAEYSRSAGVQYDRPRSIPAHPEHGVAEELRPVERHLGYRIDSLAGKRLNEMDDHPGPQPMPMHQDRQAHRYAVPRIAHPRNESLDSGGRDLPIVPRYLTLLLAQPVPVLPGGPGWWR